MKYFNETIKNIIYIFDTHPDKHNQYCNTYSKH